MHKFLRWFIVVQILWSATSAWEATFITGFVGFAIALMYVHLVELVYRPSNV